MEVPLGVRRHPAHLQRQLRMRFSGHIADGLERAMNIQSLFASLFVLSVMLVGTTATPADACKIDKEAAAKIQVQIKAPKDLGRARANGSSSATLKTTAQLKDLVTFERPPAIIVPPTAPQAKAARPAPQAKGAPSAPQAKAAPPAPQADAPPLLPPECMRKLILFINGLPAVDARPLRDSPLTFVLDRTEKSAALWRPLLGRPSVGDERDVDVGFGLPDGPALYSAGIKIETLPSCWFYLWCGIFVVSVVGFFLCAIMTSILRDGTPDPRAEPGSKSTYSLARTQAAWWLFVVLACYMLIGVATGDFLSSINGTAVMLLGIGAGTALGGAAVDASKDTPRNRQEQRAATVVAASRMSDAALSEQEKAEAQSQHNKLMGVSQNFITDILSDANGVSFHRFQMVAWTLVLSAVFVAEVYENLAMPTFGPVLIGLLGLSAGTYVGLKIPEPVVPTK
jgi:hypothetical protein